MRQLVCTSCEAINRLPDDKDPLAGKCGRCGARLFTGAPVEVTGPQLARHLSATQGAGLLLDVWAPWCGPCRAMAPQFAAAAARLEPKVRLLKLNSDQAQEAAAQLGVRSIPTLILFRGGEPAGQTAGLMNADQIVAWTEQTLAV